MRLATLLTVLPALTAAAVPPVAAASPPPRLGPSARASSSAAPSRSHPTGPDAWRPPVPGAVTRGFRYGADPFRRGWHRGADFLAAPGATVRAACSGRVATARAGGPGAGVVTLRCGPWRVTHLPLSSVAVRAGTRVAAGARLGVLAPSRAHAGLHLGVRRAGDRFAYVDPLPFLRTPGDGAPLRLPRTGPRASPARRVPAAPLHQSTPHGAPAPRPVPAATPHPAAPPPDRPAPRVRVPPAGAVAPWPAWAGLAVLLSGAVGGGVRWRARRRRAGTSAVVGRGVA